MQMEPKLFPVTPGSELDRLLDEAADRPLVLEKDGACQAAIISCADLKRFRQLEQQRRERFRALEDTWTAFKDAPAEEIEREVSRAIDEVRVEKRAAGSQ